MKASEIPVGHLCYNNFLGKYGITGYYWDSDRNQPMIFWLHNFCMTPISKCLDEYQDLGPAPQFKVTQKEIVKTVWKVEVINSPFFNT